MTKDNETYNDDGSVYDTHSDAVYDDSMSQNYDQGYESAYDDTQPIDDPNATGDDWQTDDQNDVTDLSAPEEKKSLLGGQSNIVKILLGVASVIILFFAYLMMSGDESNVVDADSGSIASVPASGDTAPPPVVISNAEAPSNLAQLQAMPPAVGPENVNAQSDVTNPDQGQGLMSDPSLLEKMENPLAAASTTIETPVPAEETAKSSDKNIVGENVSISSFPVQPLVEDASADVAPKPNELPSIPPSQTAQTIVTPISDFPTVDSIRKLNQTDTTASESITSEAAAPQVVVNETSQDTLSAVTSIPAVPDKVSSPIVASDDGAKDKRIAQLEKEIAEKDRLLSQKETEMANPEEKPTEEVEALKARIAELEKRLKNQAVAAKPREDSSIVQTRKSISQPKEVKQARQWNLKSIRSGSGAILIDKKTGDSKSIRIGDTISGIGRITFIGNDGGRWVVKGTQGMVSQ